MGAVVTFDIAKWRALYPEFNNVSNAAASAYFDLACAFHSNGACGRVRDPSLQLALLNMMTAHLTFMRSMRDSQGNPSSTGTQQPSPLVGRISNASEGSVSVATEYAPASDPPSRAWYEQTKYGADYYAATAGFRTMHYRAPLGRAIDPWAARFTR